MVGPAAGLRIEKRIFVLEIVKALLRLDHDDRQRLRTEHADGQFVAGDVFLDQQRVVILRGAADGGSDLRLLLYYIDADGRTLARGLHHVRQRQPRQGVGENDFEGRGRDAALDEPLFRLDLVERGPAPLDPLPCVRDALFIEDRLQIAILAKGAMDDVEGDVDRLGNGEFRRGDVDRHHARAALRQRLANTAPGGKRDFALGAGTAHED